MSVKEIAVNYDIDQAYLAIERAAVAGTRCPQGHVIRSTVFRQLARERKIRIEISGHNWRTVTLLTGLNAGKSTARDPQGGRIYRTIEGDNDHWHTRERNKENATPVTLLFRDGRRT